MRLTYKQYFFIALILALSFSSFAQDKPNIIFIMVDDLGYGELGCYGQEKMQTPRIDKMASEGMLFTDFYAGNAVCAPSRYSLVTGKHPGHSAVRGNFEVGHWNSFLGQLPIPEEDVTIFDIVKQEGYATATYGKWGLGRAESSGAPDRNGVDDFFGYNCQRHAHSHYPRYLEGNRGEKIWLEGNERKEGGKQHSHPLFTQKALEFISANKDNPFFLYLPYALPHAPLEVPDLGIYADKPWNEKQKKQAAMISLIDKDVGLILDLLKTLEIAENTIVFFTSDNGAKGDDHTLEFFEAGGPLRGKKSDLYEGGIRTPMIAWWPGKIEAGSTSAFAGAFWDMMPTCAELSGADLSNVETDGISFVPELTGKQQKPHDFLYWEYFSTDYQWNPGLPTTQHQLKSQALRMGKWKAIRHNKHTDFKDVPVDFSSVELYNLEEDISEVHNEASKHPEVVKDMLELMNANHSPSEYFKFEIK